MTDPITTAQAMRDAAAKVCEDAAADHEAVEDNLAAHPSDRQHAAVCAAVCRNRALDIRALPIAPTDTERKLALAVEALRHARDQIRHPDQLIDDALAAIANQEPQS